MQSTLQWCRDFSLPFANAGRLFSTSMTQSSHSELQLELHSTPTILSRVAF